MQKYNVAIVGAGMSALACAKILSKSFNVVIFQKSRGVGGRMSTKRKDDWLADQGASYYTARSQSFIKLNQQWMKRQIAQKWNAKIGVFSGGVWTQSKPQTRYVGKPSMKAIANQLSLGLNIKLQSLVKNLSKKEDKWQVQLQTGLQPLLFDKVIISAPNQQAAKLVQSHSQKLLSICNSVKMLPCIALIAVYKQPVKIPYDAAFINHHGAISWIANNSTKPGRKAQPQVWVIHTTPQFSAMNWDAQDSILKPTINYQFKKLGAHQPDSMQIHKWKYANCMQPLDIKFSGDKQLYLIGDWLNKGRVEGAYLSGQSLAEHILTTTKL